MTRTADQVLRDFVAAQSSGDVDAVSRMVSNDAVFDVGRGRFEGDGEVRRFVDRLHRIHSRTHVLSIATTSPTRVVALLEQRDDDLVPLGIDHLTLDVEVEVTADGRIRTFTARPTAKSMEALMAARAAGHRSEGVTLAEHAGTLPPPDDRSKP